MRILIVIDDYFNQINGMCISTQRFVHEYKKMEQEVRVLSTGEKADYPVPELKINIPFTIAVLNISIKYPIDIPSNNEEAKT